MKDLLLVAINAKYSHTNLAIRYLRDAANDLEVELLEMSINDSINQIMSHLLESEITTYGFSCYIWNIEVILKVAELLKKARPQALILLGGPEVSFESEKLLIDYPFIDCIIAGSGELKLPRLMGELKSGNLTFTEGVYYSDQLKERANTNSSYPSQTNDEKGGIDLDDFPSPYTEKELSVLKNRIIYYETIRGCPYRCSYCLSSLDRKLELKPLDLIFKEIDLFFKVGVKQVKLVDRTFNCQPRRAIAVFDYIIRQAKKYSISKKIDTGKNEFINPLPNFHFEMTGDQILPEMINCLKEAPQGLIQFEIGVQTTYKKTLKAIDRPIDFKKTKNHVNELLKDENIHIHLDLIAGLPYETFDVFSKSFNDVIALKPDMLQLGFLKGLKGTKIRNESDQHAYEFSSFPPYEIIKNAFLSAEELYLLRDIETVLDRYYNSGYFSKTLDYLLFSKDGLEPFEFFKEFAKWWRIKGYFDRGIAKESLYEILHHYLNEKCLFKRLGSACLSYDYYYHNQLKDPKFCQLDLLPKELVFEFLRKNKNRDLYLSEYGDWPAKKIFSQIKILKFNNEFYQFLHPATFNEFLQLDYNQDVFLLLTKQGGSTLISLYDTD